MANAISASRVTVTTAATALHTADPGSGSTVTVHNKGTASVDLGDATVTSGAGYELASGESFSFGDAGDVLYAITASGTVRVDVIRTEVGS